MDLRRVEPIRTFADAMVLRWAARRRRVVNVPQPSSCCHCHWHGSDVDAGIDLLKSRLTLEHLEDLAPASPQQGFALAIDGDHTCHRLAEKVLWDFVENSRADGGLGQLGHRALF